MAEAVNAILHPTEIGLSDAAVQRIRKCRQFLDDYLLKEDRPIYGINTGFGALHDVSISEENLNLLQENLVRSHACGTGDLIEEHIVRLMMLLKIQGLSLGHSGVQLKTVELLVAMFNRRITPLVYSKGSLGASGDLAPLAHMSLPLIGSGEVFYEGRIVDSKVAFEAEGLNTIELKSKEGLALLNGTQFMSAHAAFVSVMAERLFDWADFIAGVSLEAMDGHLSPFFEGIHRLRPHEGQISTAAKMRELLKDSQLIKQEKAHVQDPYCLRCIPQVHGASRDTLSYVMKVTQTELNSVTDNPTIFPEEEMIVSAGNFHGQPLAISLDLIAIAMSEIGSISERRSYKLNGGGRGLPSFLVKKPGLNSGFMITQYTSASVVSENKQLCSPASVDTIDSSQGQEDHVSMGANAATKAKKVLDNLARILSIELFTAAQALEFRGIDRSSNRIQEVLEEFRKIVPFIEQDEEMYRHMKSALNFITQNSFTDV